MIAGVKVVSAVVKAVENSVDKVVQKSEKHGFINNLEFYCYMPIY